MKSSFFLSIAMTGFAVAFLHAAIPTHWLPFVLAGRGQGWPQAKTLVVTSLAGIGHALFTTALGVLVVWLGIETSRWTGDVFPYVAGSILIAFGLYYIVHQVRGDGHRHLIGSHHRRHAEEHSCEQAHAVPNHLGEDQACHRPRRYGSADGVSIRKSDTAVILGLFATLTFSPCEGFLPVYLSGIQYGWAAFVLLSAVLALATITGMTLLTWLTITGLKRFNLEALERYESGLLGGVLCLLGVAVMFIE